MKGRKNECYERKNKYKNLTKKRSYTKESRKKRYKK